MLNGSFGDNDVFVVTSLMLGVWGLIVLTSLKHVGYKRSKQTPKDKALALIRPVYLYPFIYTFFLNFIFNIVFVKLLLSSAHPSARRVWWSLAQLDPKHQRRCGMRQVSYDTGRCFVHLIPLIVTDEICFKMFHCCWKLDIKSTRGFINYTNFSNL